MSKRISSSNSFCSMILTSIESILKNVLCLILNLDEKKNIGMYLNSSIREEFNCEKRILLLFFSKLDKRR